MLGTWNDRRFEDALTSTILYHQTVSIGESHEIGDAFGSADTKFSSINIYNKIPTTSPLMDLDFLAWTG